MAHEGHVIRAMRETQGLSLRRLAELAEVDAGYLCDVENGNREPGDRWLASVTRALGRNLREGELAAAPVDDEGDAA